MKKSGASEEEVRIFDQEFESQQDADRRAQVEMESQENRNS
jgi:hypothetical protein